jgi:hypothetical protein
VAWDHDTSVADTHYLFMDVTATAQAAVHAGDCPSRLELAAYASDDGGALHLLCLRRSYEKNVVTAVHGVVRDFEKVEWGPPVRFRTERWTSGDPALLALADRGAYAVLSAHVLEPVHSTLADMFADGEAAERGWEIHPLRPGAAMCKVECPLGFFTRGDWLVGIAEALVGWQNRRIITSDLGGACSAVPLRLVAVPGILPAYDWPVGGDYAPWGVDLPVLWSKEPKGPIALALPLPAPSLDPSYPAELQNMRSDAAARLTFSSARPAGGPRSFGPVSFVPEVFVHMGLLLDDQQVTLPELGAKWARVSCDEEGRCVLVYWATSYEHRDRLEIRRFTLADVRRRFRPKSTDTGRPSP